ncbi:hypothetical protein BDW72DRAFT_212974 [Aspergillus terricola var. indicus]
MVNRGKTYDPMVHSIQDLERLGSNKMSKMYREYYNEGVMDLITLRENQSAYDRYLIRPRALRNVANLDTTTTILGSKVKFPCGFSPTAMHALAHPDGEVATIKEAMIQMIKGAEAAGFKALLLTLDVPYLGRRLNEFRNNFNMPKGMEYPNLFPGLGVTNLDDGNEIMDYVSTAADAELAIIHGLDGIVISNHGGRQLDSVPSTLDVLREVVPVTKGEITIVIDGGIRRGTDIFKALALGAEFCLAGRPAIWGLAYDGQAGVELAINLLYDEFRNCMALAGCKDISDISRDHVSLLQQDGRLLKL